MVGRTLTGLPSFDEHLGGAYDRRPLLCIGAHGTGKTLAALRFVQQGLVGNERALYLSSMPVSELVALAERMGFPLAVAVQQRLVTVVEYATLQGTSPLSLLPASDFIQVQRVVETQRLGRLVLDTILPWVAEPSSGPMRVRVHSFVHELDELGVSSFATLPEAVSPLATDLTKRLLDLMPVTITLTQVDQTRFLTVKRYLGQVILPQPQPYRIELGAGLVGVTTPPPPPLPTGRPAK